MSADGGKGDMAEVAAVSAAVMEHVISAQIRAVKCWPKGRKPARRLAKLNGARSTIRTIKQVAEAMLKEAADASKAADSGAVLPSESEACV